MGCTFLPEIQFAEFKVAPFRALDAGVHITMFYLDPTNAAVEFADDTYADISSLPVAVR